MADNTNSQNKIVQYVILGVEEAVKIVPGLIDDLRKLFAKPDPTPQDWADLRAKIAAKQYSDYVNPDDLDQTK